jgi:hypothetical protein
MIWLTSVAGSRSSGLSLDGQKQPSALVIDEGENQ